MRMPGRWGGPLHKEECPVALARAVAGAPALDNALPTQCKQCEVRHLTLCSPLDGSEMQRLTAILKVVDLPAGSSIADEGEAADHVYNVTGGAVRLYKLLSELGRASCRERVCQYV